MIKKKIFYCYLNEDFKIINCNTLMTDKFYSGFKIYRENDCKLEMDFPGVNLSIVQEKYNTARECPNRISKCNSCCALRITLLSGHDNDNPISLALYHPVCVQLDMFNVSVPVSLVPRIYTSSRDMFSVNLLIN